MIDIMYDQYVQDVLDGTQPASVYVKKACERHVRDQARDDLVFDSDEAQKVILFFYRYLRHWKGVYAGDPVILEPWQQFITASLMGWKYKATGLRRYKTAYITVARKNGKTLWAAGLALYLMTMDGEPGAEIYSAATKKDQAKILHTDAIRMVEASPVLQTELGLAVNNIHHLPSKSKFEPLGRDSSSLDGLNIHCFIADELHAWKRGDTWEKLDTATGARTQPLGIAITTAGHDRQSICYGQHEYVQKILDQILEDDEYFGIIYELDPEDLEPYDWEDPETGLIETRPGWANEANWEKANPNLGVSKLTASMRKGARQAGEITNRLDPFLQLHLNIWTRSHGRWINPDKWALLGGRLLKLQPGDLDGRTCYIGVDLSTKVDITAVVALFPPAGVDYIKMGRTGPGWFQKNDDGSPQSPGGEPWVVVPHFFVPEANSKERETRDKVPYWTWGQMGHVHLTPGNIVDYSYIVEVIEGLAQRYYVEEIAYDPWRSVSLITKLIDLGYEVTPVHQGYKSMAPAMIELEGMIIDRTLAHGDHPTLNWMAHNMVASRDPAGNMKPDKDVSYGRIDGMSGLLTALARAIQAGVGESVYEGEGVLILD